ncbi:MAG: hypothetical protein F8N37_17725 [Telmatospirillum sp.]|nr:hypothetical protein [Telmatospirillum sp.]
MPTDHFVKVFDVTESGFRDWGFSAFGLIFVAIGIIIFVFPKIISKTGIPYLNIRSTWNLLFRYFFLGFSVLWTCMALYFTYSQHLKHEEMVRYNKCRVVEGPVQNFVPMPYTGHAEESFSVSGVRFQYSDYIVTDAFNNTSSHGGPVNDNSYVRICYDPVGNAILRLEIRYYEGKIENYSRDNTFFSLSDLKMVKAENSPPPMPWYGNLFIILFLLDMLGILTLFRRYLETFLKIKAIAINDNVIRGGLVDGKMVKLRNSIIYWDKANYTIWLRPRGLNIVHAPMMVAKLNTSKSGTNIISTEIRLSSGCIAIIAAFLWAAYNFLSKAMPSNVVFPSPIIFIGVFFLMFLFVGGINLKILRGRMEKLIGDALPELTVPVPQRSSRND